MWSRRSIRKWKVFNGFYILFIISWLESFPEWPINTDTFRLLSLPVSIFFCTTHAKFMLKSFRTVLEQRLVQRWRTNQFIRYLTNKCSTSPLFDRLSRLSRRKIEEKGWHLKNRKNKLAVKFHNLSIFMWEHMYKVPIFTFIPRISFDVEEFDVCQPVDIKLTENYLVLHSQAILTCF